MWGQYQRRSLIWAYGSVLQPMKWEGWRLAWRPGEWIQFLLFRNMECQGIYAPAHPPLGFGLQPFKKNDMLLSPNCCQNKLLPFLVRHRFVFLRIGHYNHSYQRWKPSMWMICRRTKRLHYPRIDHLTLLASTVRKSLLVEFCTSLVTSHNLTLSNALSIKANCRSLNWVKIPIPPETSLGVVDVWITAGG